MFVVQLLLLLLFPELSSAGSGPLGYFLGSEDVSSELGISSGIKCYALLRNLQRLSTQADDSVDR